jgi:hypothetical protein
MPGVESAKGLLGRIRGKDKLSTMENVCILLVIIGAVVLSLGTGMTIISPQGIPAAMSMAGAVIAFLGTALLVLTWTASEILGRKP